MHDSKNIELRSGSNAEWFARYAFEQDGMNTDFISTHGQTHHIEQLPSGQRSGVQAIFDGFLFDRKELAKELGVGLETVTDGGLAVIAFQRFGRDVFQKLRGRYLFAVTDDKTGELLLGHDGMGMHPVYYARVKEGLLFATNIFALAYSGQVSREPNRLTMALALTIVHPPEIGETAFANISRLRPGYYLRVCQNGRSQEHCFWQIIPEDYEPLPCNYDIYEAFEEKFTAAVTRCMSREPQGIMLSGGLDSVSVAIVASEHRKKASLHLPPLTACCARTVEGYGSTEEHEGQDRVAAHLGLPRFYSDAVSWMEGKNLIEATLELNVRHPGPADPWWAGSYIRFHQQVVQQGITRVLTGSGGDEWLGIHPAYAADLIRSFAPLKLFGLLKSRAVTANYGWRQSSRSILWTHGIGLLLDSYFAQFMPVRRGARLTRLASGQIKPWMFPDHQLAQQVIEIIKQKAPSFLAKNNKYPTSYYHQALRNTWRNPRMHWEQERNFHIGRSIGLESLHPYHDQDLADWCNRLPGHIFFKGGENKTMVRPLIKKHYGGFGLEKQRKISGDGRESFVCRQLRENINAYWQEAKIEKLAEAGIVDISRLTGIGGQSLPKFGNALDLYSMMIVEHWMQTHAS